MCPIASCNWSCNSLSSFSLFPWVSNPWVVAGPLNPASQNFKCTWIAHTQMLNTNQTILVNDADYGHQLAEYSCWVATTSSTYKFYSLSSCYVSEPWQRHEPRMNRKRIWLVIVCLFIAAWDSSFAKATAHRQHLAGMVYFKYDFLWLHMVEVIVSRMPILSVELFTEVC